jgi:putative tryptophan/tyrosine transport system substrate-binding protein
MRSRLVLLLTAAVLITAFGHAHPQPRMPRVAVLWAGPLSFAQPYITAGLDAMRTLGWIDGQNIVVDYRLAPPNVITTADRLANLVRNAEDLARIKVDAIVAVGDPAVEAARRATSTIPIVMLAVGDAVGAGFVSSLARPGGNVTGIGALSVDLSGKRLELLKQIVPRASRVAVLWSPANPAGLLGFRETESAARVLGVTLQSLPVRQHDELATAFAAMARERADGLVVVTDPLTWTARREIVQLATKHRLPAVYELREYVDTGGLASYGPSLVALSRRVAVYVDRILKGAKPAELPVEQPTELELVMSLKAAQAITLTIPQSSAGHRPRRPAHSVIRRRRDADRVTGAARSGWHARRARAWPASRGVPLPARRARPRSRSRWPRARAWCRPHRRRAGRAGWTWTAPR